jgi:hypothetical protein
MALMFATMAFVKTLAGIVAVARSPDGVKAMRQF